MQLIWRSEGHICRSDNILQLQSEVMLVVLTAIPDANIAPKKYELLKNEVKVARSFGYPSSPIKEDADIMQRTTPKPRVILANMYMPTSNMLARRTSSSIDPY